MVLMVEQKTDKSHLIKAEPLPISKIKKKRLHDLYGKILKALGSPDLLFQRGSVMLNLKVKLRISETYLKQHIHNTSTDSLKMIIELYIIIP